MRWKNCECLTERETLFLNGVGGPALLFCSLRCFQTFVVSFFAVALKSRGRGPARRQTSRTSALLREFSVYHTPAAGTFPDAKIRRAVSIRTSRLVFARSWITLSREENFSRHCVAQIARPGSLFSIRRRHFFIRCSLNSGDLQIF